MKKVFLSMTAMAAILMLNISCKDDKWSDQDKQDFVTKLTATTWEGWNKNEYKRIGEWVENGGDYVTMQFTRSGSQALSGTGLQIGYETPGKLKELERSEFKWNISGDRIYIDYNAGWSSVDARCQDLEISATKFRGKWYNTRDNDRRFVFDYSNLQ